MDQDQFDFNNSKGIKSLFEVALDTLTDTESFFDSDNASERSGALDIEGILEIDGLTLTRQLGTGSMGEVWPATQHRPHRLVAVKFIRSNILQSARVKYRFLREIELTGKLDHPGVCQIYDAGVSGGYVYYFMKYVEGANLNEYLADRELTTEAVIKLVIAICDAVHHAHQQGVVHRDLKPSNIVVDHQGEPHVLDFGIASTIHLNTPDDPITLTFDEEVIGTVKYMSPEQARGHHNKINTESDIYTIGVILYQILTGRYPFDDGTDFEIREQISKGAILRPRSIRSDISKDLEAVVLKAMQLNPDDRYHSAAEFADDLDNVLSGNPVTARKVTVPYLIQKNVKKHPLRYASLISVIMIIITLLSWNYFSIKQQRDVNAELAELNAQGNHDRTIAMVSKDIQLGQIRSAAAELDTIPKRLRNIEYRILNRVLDNRVWSLEVPRGHYHQISYSSDSSLLTLSAISGMQQTIYMPDITKTPEKIQAARETYRYFANDGRYGIKIVEDGDSFPTYQIFNTENSNLEIMIPDPDKLRPNSFHLSEDLQYIAYSSGKSLGYIDMKSATIKSLMTSERMKFYRAKMSRHHILVGISADAINSELVVYDIKSDEYLLRKELPGKDRYLAIHPQLPLIATRDKDGRITIWEYEDKKLEALANFPMGTDDVTSVRFSVREPSVIVTYHDGTTSRLNYLDHTVYSYNGISYIACSAIDFESSDYFITAGMDEIACYKINAYSSYGTPTEHQLLQYSQSPVVVYAEADTEIYRMYTVSKNRLNEYDFATNRLAYKSIPGIRHHLIVNSHGQLYFMIHKNAQTTLHTLDSQSFHTDQPEEVRSFDFKVSGFRCIPDSDLLVLESYGREINVYDTEKDMITQTVSNINLAVPSSNGKHLFATTYFQNNNNLTTIRRYDTANWTYENLITVEHPVKYLHVSNRDQWLIIANTVFDLSIFDIHNKKLIQKRKFHSNKALSSIIFSEDDRRMIIGGEELTIINTATWRPTLVIPRTGNQRSVPILQATDNSMLYVLKRGRITTYP